MSRKMATAGGRGDGAEEEWHARIARWVMVWSKSFHILAREACGTRLRGPKPSGGTAVFNGDGDGKGRLQQQPAEPSETARGSKVPHCTYRYGPGTDGRAQCKSKGARGR